MKVHSHKQIFDTCRFRKSLEEGREEENGARGGGCGKVDCLERKGVALLTQPGSQEFQFVGPHTLQLVLGLPEVPSHVYTG